MPLPISLMQPTSSINIEGQDDGQIGSIPVDGNNASVTDELPQDGQLSLATAARELLSHSMKFTLCRLIYIGGNVVGLTILGSEDEQHLAASSLINSTQTAILYTTTGVMFIIGIYARGALAERRLPEIGALFRKGMVMSLELGAPALLLTQFVGPLLRLAHQPADVTNIISQYNSCYSFAVPANVMFMHNIQLLLATNNYSAIAMQSTLYSALLVPLSYSLMNGYGRLPKLGAQGVGLANLVASWASVLTTALYLILSKDYRPYRLLDTRAGENHAPSVKKLIQEGASIGLQAGMETFYVIILTELIGLISQDDLSASAPALHTTNIIAPIIFGLAHISGVLTRHAVGEKRFQDARQYGYASLMVGGLIPTAALLLFSAMPNRIVSLFIDPNSVGNDRIIEQAKLFLTVSTISLIPDAVRNIFAGTLRAYNDTAFAMASSTFSIAAVGMLASVLLGFKSSLSSLGVFLGRTLAFTVGAMMMTSYWHRKSHAINDEISLRSEQNRSLTDNIQTWVGNSLLAPFKRNSASTDTHTAGGIEARSLLGSEQTLYGSLSDSEGRNIAVSSEIDSRLNPALTHKVSTS